MTATKEKLHSAEISIYSFIWITAVVYGIYNVYLVGNFFKHDFDSEDFSTGWISSRKKDVSDYEWAIWVPLLRYLAPWLLGHLIVSEVIRWFNLKLLPFWYILLPSVILIKMFGVLSASTVLVQPLIFCLIANFSRSKALTWFTSFAIMCLMNTHPLTQDWFQLNHKRSYMLSVAQMWIHLRCISFCLDVQSGSVKPSLKDLLAYCLYLPLNFLGPIVLFPEFKHAMGSHYVPWTLTRLKNFILGVIRYVFWLVVNEAWLHVIYSSALSFQPDIVVKLDAPTLYGLGYCMGQFFMVKYTVVYGLPGVLAKAEGVPAPNPPKCIGRIHLYSDMWRTFDQGLYNFLSRYIYAPITRGSSNLLIRGIASLACFTFVYLWHGTMLYIFIWSLLNYIGVTIEVIARKIAINSKFQQWENSWLSPKGVIRFHAIFTSVLLFMSALSNFYFFAGQEVGNIFVYRTLQGIGGPTLVVLALLYCCCHFSDTVKQWEQTKGHVKDKNCLQ